MERYRNYYPRDDPPLADDDGGFRGVNMRLDPGQLPAGTAAEGRNVRFVNGVAMPRLGLHKPTWANNVTGSALTKFVGVLGAGVFTAPDGLEWLIVVDLRACWKLRPALGPSQVRMPTGFAPVGPVQFVQCLNALIMFQGTDTAPLEMTDLDEGFKSIAKRDTSETLELDSEGGDPIVMDDYDTDLGTVIPNSDSGCFFQNRLLIPYDFDLVAVSDYLNYTRYAPVRNAFRINQGQQDKLVALYKFSASAVLCLKSHSVHIVYNLTGDLSTAVLDEITREYGCRSPRTVCAVGADVWWLSEGGVMGVKQTTEGKVQGISLPLSEAIQPLINRINWKFADNARAAYWENRYYLAVPLDAAGPVPVVTRATNLLYTITGLIPGRTYAYKPGTVDTWLDYGTVPEPMRLIGTGEFVAQADSAHVDIASPGLPAWNGQIQVVDGVNTAILVYDFLNQAWSGYDDAEGFYPQEFVQMKLKGRNRLMCLDAFGFINVLEDGAQDQVYDATLAAPAVIERPVPFMLLTRGYRCGDLAEKRFNSSKLAMREWGAQYTVAAKVEGVLEERTLRTVTRSRLKYLRPWNRPHYDPTNVNDDADEPYREDYSVALNESGAGTAAIPDHLHLGAAGVRLDDVQDLAENYRPNLFGEHLQLRITGVKGRVELVSVQTRALPGRRAGGKKG